MFKWLEKLLFGNPTEEDKRVIEAIKRLPPDAKVTPRGGLTRDPKVVASEIDWGAVKEWWDKNVDENGVVNMDDAGRPIKND